MMWEALWSANSAWRRICPGIYSWSCTTMPPVSISSKRRPSCSAVPCIRSRVMPGSSPTMERRCPVIRLKRVDFPTLGLPTMTTVGMAFDMILHDSRRRHIDVRSALQKRSIQSEPRPVRERLRHTRLQFVGLEHAHGLTLLGDDILHGRRDLLWFPQ